MSSQLRKRIRAVLMLSALFAVAGSTTGCIVVHDHHHHHPYWH